MSVLLCLNEGLEFKVLDPKRALHLSLSATGINQVRWQIVSLSFFDNVSLI